MNNMTNFRVYLRSVPGPYEQYDGHLDVTAEDREHATGKALRELRLGSFPDRSAEMWRIEGVEQI